MSNCPPTTNTRGAKSKSPTRARSASRAATPTATMALVARSRSGSTRSQRRSGSSSRMGAQKAKTRVKAYGALSRELGASLEQVWPNAFWLFKYVPPHAVGTVAGPAQVFAMHIEPGAFRTLDKLEDIGMSPSQLIQEKHIRKLRAGDFSLEADQAEYLNYWIHKSVGTRMAVNDFYGEDVQTTFVSSPFDGADVGRVKAAQFPPVLQDIVTRLVSQNAPMPVRDAAFLLSVLRPRAAGADALSHYNAFLRALRARADAGKTRRSIQHVAFSHGLHAWISAARDPVQGPDVRQWDKSHYVAARQQTDAFFDSLSWDVVKASTDAATANANQLAMLRYAKVHRAAQMD